MIAPTYRPLVSPLEQVQPHVVAATVGLVLIQPVKATVATPSVVGAPDFFVSATGDDGDDGTTAGTAWQTIGKVNAQTFNPGDIIAFNGGDTFNDATLTPGQSGIADNPITFTSYGTGKAILDGADARNCVNLNNDFLKVANMQLRDCGNGGGAAMIELNGADNCEIVNCTIGPQTLLTGGGRGIQVDNSNGLLVDTCSIDVVAISCINITNGSANGTVKDTFIGDNGENTGPFQGEGIGFQNSCGSGWLLTGCTFDCDPTAPSGENCLDIKSGVHTVESCEFIDAKQDLMIIHEGNGSGIQTNVTFNDCLWHGRAKFGQNNGGTEDTIAVCNRCLFLNEDGVNQCGAGSGGAGDFTFNGCAFLIPAGEVEDYNIRITVGCTVDFFNCTFVALNGNNANQLINVNAFTGTAQARNSVFHTDGAGVDVTNNIGAITWSNNLYDAGSGQNPGGTGSTTGDADFDSTDPDNADFLLPQATSDALNLGNTAFAPATDYVGTSYDDPPNAGCREGNA